MTTKRKRYGIPEEVLKLLKPGMRVAVMGPPRTGKTTLADEIAEHLETDSVKHTGKRESTAATNRSDPRHTDDLISRGWSQASDEASHWFDAPGPWIIEGSMGVRAMRKWLKRNSGMPVDLVVWQRLAKVHRTKGQESMAKGTETIWKDVLPELLKRGVEVVTLTISPKPKDGS